MKLHKRYGRLREAAQEIFPLYLNIARRFGFGTWYHYRSMDIEVPSI
jgi:hypothetical protein